MFFFAPPLYFSFCCFDLLILYFSFCEIVLFVFPVLLGGHMTYDKEKHKSFRRASGGKP